MEKKIKEIEEQAKGEILAAFDESELESLRIKYLGRKAVLNSLFAEIPGMDPDKRAGFGKSLNETKEKISCCLEKRLNEIKSKEKKLDLTLPSEKISRGTKHILTYVTENICGIFRSLGFGIVEGNEIEDEWHNFSALNIPMDHPSRDVFDTFYLGLPSGQGGKKLLRSHTSPSQIRVMLKEEPPFAVISPGRVYRPDKADASHSFMFNQIEGFCVDKHINFSHLKGVLFYFAKSFFTDDVTLRFRPHFFPFTEPSAEVDVSCLVCKGKGCSVCSYKGWLEVLGCGMIHPNVLKACSIDFRKYKGFAFGMGIDRLAMLKYRVNDIRLFFENDERFLEQFYEI